MTFFEELAYFVLRQSDKQLAELAIRAIQEGYDSAEMYIVAGQSEKESNSDYLHYFLDALSKHKIEIPPEEKALFIVIKHICLKIVRNEINAFEGMSRIDFLYKNSELFDNAKQDKFLGQSLGLEYMYTWFREMQDWRCESLALYYSDLSRNEQWEKFEQHLIEEIERFLTKRM